MSNTALRRGLLDTPLVLAIQLGDPGAFQFADDMLRGPGIEFSAVSALALLAQARDPAERSARIVFITHTTVHPITARISRRALALLSALVAPSSITADDAVVAATAIEHSLPLYTLDPARLANLAGVATVRAY